MSLRIFENQNDKLDALIKLTKLETTISFKLYINDVVKSFFRRPSKSKIRELKKSIKQLLNLWPEDRRDEFRNECYRTIQRYEAMQPSKWKKWGYHIIKIIDILR